ncbi:MAG TPA: isoaspartyl peptidase/L-asparaginase [Candidatus Binataceae bacterium]|jgi:beta-aspartyl-peptidase (threonine type)
MSRGTITPSLIAHGGAGGRAPAADRVARRRGMLDAVGRGAEILRGGGSALDAVVATVVALENDPLFNAGYGSVLTTAGRVEMDAAVMTATRSQSALGEHAANVNGARVASGPTGRRAARTVAVQIRAGGVVLVSRVRNPIELARAVMERTPHLLMGGAGAERIARQAALALCRPQDLVSPRARERWLAARELIGQPSPPDQFAADAHGTVGAVAIDARGAIAAATSTGGVSGKLPGRIGDSAIIGAGLFADGLGGASATGEGEAIMRVALCREAVLALARIRPRERMTGSAQAAAERTIAMLSATTGAQAGVILVDSRGEFGFAHSAEVMELAMFHPDRGLRHRVAEPLIKSVGKLRQPRG